MECGDSFVALNAPIIRRDFGSLLSRIPGRVFEGRLQNIVARKSGEGIAALQSAFGAVSYFPESSFQWKPNSKLLRSSSGRFGL
jgi:hypothetical protein